MNCAAVPDDESPGDALSATELDTWRARARSYRRWGPVQAVRLTAALTWQNDYGSELVGQAGDWLCRDRERFWTVQDAAFRRRYRRRWGQFWRRGEVLAVRCDADVTVATLEGQARARAGDWLCFDPDSGEYWPVVAEAFTGRPLAPRRARRGNRRSPQ